MAETTTPTPTPPSAPTETPSDGAKLPKRNKYEKKTKKKGLPKVIKVGIPLILAAGAAFGAIHFIRGNTKKADPDIIEAMATFGDLSTFVQGSGSISPVSKEEYGGDIKGTVSEVAVDVEDAVHPGDLLFTIDASEVRADLTSARADLSNLQRQQSDAAKNYKTAVRALEDARAEYAKCVVTSPTSGMIFGLPDSVPKVWEVLSPGTVLCTVVDNSAMRLILFFNRAYISDIYVGQEVIVSVPDSMAQVTGTVASINDQARPIDGAPCFSIEVKVPNSGGLAEKQPATGYIPSPGGEIRPSLDGELEYWSREDVRFEGVAAKVTAINIKEYGTVTKGMTLCTVDTRPASDAIENAKSTVDDYARQINGETAQNEIKKAQERIAELEKLAETNAVYCTIDGIVSSVSIKAGDKLSGGGTAVITVSDTSSLVMNVNIDEADISNVSVGMPVDISYDTTDGMGTAFGEVTYVSFEAKSSNPDSPGSSYAYFPATITLSNDEGVFRPGMSANYSILATQREGCILVPGQCIVNTDLGPVVFVKEGQEFEYERVEFEEGLVPEGYYAVSVEVGISDADFTEIISGIEPDTVLYQTTVNTSEDFYW